MKTKRICKAVKNGDSPCDAAALAGSDFCFFHDPSKADARRAAQSSGGHGNRMQTLDATTPDVKVQDTKDVVVLMSETINQVRKGVLDPRVANAIGYLATIAMKAVDQSQLEQRIAKLEALSEDRIGALTNP